VQVTRTCCDAHSVRAVVDLFAGKEDVDRVKTGNERRVLDVPQIRGLLGDHRTNCVLSALRVDNANVDDTVTAA